MKTDKFNNMIEAFECDFKLAVQGDRTLSELDKRIKEGNLKLLHDIDLLQELSYLLRHGGAEIHLVEESAEWKEHMMNHFTKGE